MGEALGVALANLINIFNFPLYLLSGGPLPAWDFFAPAMLEEVTRRSFTYRQRRRRSKKRRWAMKPGFTVRRICRSYHSMKLFFWAFDIGTGGSRALLVDEQGRVRHAFTAPHEEMRMERPLWAEQRPENWWDAAQAAIRGVLRESGFAGADVRAVGLSGQMHGLTLLDATDRVIRPALIWCDQRSQPQVDWINEHAGADFVVKSTANPMLTGFTLPKLLWVRDHEPENYARVKKVLLPKDYIRFELTGEYASDVSDASGTGSVRRRESPLGVRLADRVGVARDLLPPVVESSAITGRIHARAAAATGLKEGTPVVAGGGDQAASAVGNGIVEPGIVSCTIGTSGVVFGHLKEPAYDPQGRVHTFCHAVRRRVAHHGRDARCGAQPAVVPQSIRTRRELRRPHAGSRRRGRGRTLLASLFNGRADAASGPVRARRMERRDGETHAGRPDSRADRRREL